ncbi:MAG: lysophospholipid acyltransferase family protein [Candidatus Dormibacteria bacterium]
MSSTARERGRRRAGGMDTIRDAAWQSATASGLTPEPTSGTSGAPPLTGTSGTSSARRQRAASKKQAPPRRNRASDRLNGISIEASPAVVAGRNGTGHGGATLRPEFERLVGDDDDWRANPSAAGRFADRILDRIASGTFELRDPDLIRESLPLSWLFATAYFRATVDGIENIPDTGPCLLVGNHSGGNYIPDSFILGMAFATYFGSERPWYALTHSAAMAAPLVGNLLKAFGSIPASRENANEALSRGACVLVYPGGDIETYRPWSERNLIKFAGRRGFIRTALTNQVPLVPVVNIGSHETGIFLSDGQWLCKLLGLDTRLRIKATPIQVGLPWGIWATDFLPRVLLPAKIGLRVLPEVTFPQTGAEAAADDDYVQECYERVTTVMQEALTDMASRRRWPIIG